MVRLLDFCFRILDLELIYVEIMVNNIVWHSILCIFNRTAWFSLRYYSPFKKNSYPFLKI